MIEHLICGCLIRTEIEKIHLQGGKAWYRRINRHYRENLLCFEKHLNDKAVRHIKKLEEETNE